MRTTPAYIAHQLEALEPADVTAVLQVLADVPMRRVCIDAAPLLTVTGTLYGHEAGFTRLPCGTWAEKDSPAALRAMARGRAA